MKRISAAMFFAMLIATSQLALADDPQPDQQVVFSDGTKAVTYDHCGDTDVCAVLDASNGDRLSIYSEGAAYCQPYILHFVKVHGSTTIFEYSRTINHDLPTSGAFGTRCGNSHDTQRLWITA